MTKYIFALIFFSSCTFKKGHPPKNQEREPFKILKEVVSPDKRVKAVLIENYGGATVANSFLVLLMRPNEIVEEDNFNLSIFTSDNCSDLDIAWKYNNDFSITFCYGRVFHFTNFWSDAQIDNWQYNVHINLIEGKCKN